MSIDECSDSQLSGNETPTIRELTTSTADGTEPFSTKPFLIHGHLTSQANSFPITFLADTGATGYAFVDRSLVPEICERLGIEPISLAKPKKVRGYDGKLAKKSITEAIYPNWVLLGHKQLTAPMLITDLGQHMAILGKPWMNQEKVCLNMASDTIEFPSSRTASKANTNANSELSNSSKPPPIQAPSVSTRSSKTSPNILPRPKPREGDESFTIHSIGAEAFGLLARRARQDRTEIFALSMQDIDAQLAFHQEVKAEEISLSSVETSSQNLADIKNKLPPEYHEFLDVFDRAEADKLPPNRRS